MSLADDKQNGRSSVPTTVTELPESSVAPATTQTPEAAAKNGSEQPGPRFATRTDMKAAEGVSKSKLLLLGGGLAVAVLLFVFTAVAGKSPKRPTALMQAAHSQQAESGQNPSPKSSVTPLMDAPRTTPPDNTSGQLGPADIRRTRSVDNGSAAKPMAAKPAVASSLGAVPSFADTQQRFEDPAPYNNSTPAVETSRTEQNALKESSLIFVRRQAQNQPAVLPKLDDQEDNTPWLDLTPGTRIQAKLETQISSAVLSPVVAQVEYTYAIGAKIVVPAGARVYGQLQQADRSGLVSVKFDEIELLDGAREKIDAVGTGLDLGPIKGNVYGKNTGKNFLVRAASGLGSVLAEVAGNNTSVAFSEDDMLRERLAENIGTAGDSEVMNLNANNRIVVSVPADTKIYVVFTKHEESPTGSHKAPSTSQ